MSLSKTQVIGWIMTALGALSTLFGIDFPVEQIESGLALIGDHVLAVFMLIVGPIMIWVRTLTEHPVVKGLLGLFFREASKPE